MIGVCTALELQRRGARVTLIDRREPGCETSYGNAGVLARSSLFPLNNPGMLSDLPGLLTNRRAALRYDWRFVLSNLLWASQFLWNARRSRFGETTRALDDLIRLSIPGHKQLIEASGQQALLSDKGWIFLYRSRDRFDRAGLLRRTLQDFDVDTEALTRDALTDIEPGLKPIFERALWVRGSYSVRDPGALVRAYAGLFVERGGRIERGEISAVADGERGATVSFKGGAERTADHVVMCLGPWGRTLMRQSGYAVRMGFERGYHAHFTGNSDGPGIGRPIYDTAGAYVLAPMVQGLRLTSGVELKDCAAPPSPGQLDQAETAARQAVDLGERIEDRPWLGSRPTFPDSRPAIGPAPQSRHLWVAFGHQHIGFSTGPGTAQMLADLIEGAAPPVDASPFRPGRFIRRRY